jgi:hypothetical protein
MVVLIKYRVLLEAGANPNIPDPVGQTAIFYAARVVSIDCLKLLVEVNNIQISVQRAFCNIAQVGKADVNYVDRWGNTSFSEADRMSMWEQALYLWKQGASIKGLKRANGSKIKRRFDMCHHVHLLTAFRI